MTLTEDEAKKRWCPEARVSVDGNRQRNGTPQVGTLCLGSACMAWRWVTEHGYSEDRVSKVYGNCGKVGRPP